MARRAPVVLPLVYLALALTYGLVTPTWETPDEVVNLEYARHILDRGALPVQDPAAPNAAHHPPAYFAAVAAVAALAGVDEPYRRPRFNQRSTLVGGSEVPVLLRATRDTFPFAGDALVLHLGRALSAAFGALAVALVLLTARELFPERSTLPVMAGGLAALNPQFLFAGGSLSNDTLVTLACCGAFWQGLRVLRRPERAGGWLATGTWLALGLLAKSTAAGPTLALLGAAAVIGVRCRSGVMLVRSVGALAVPIVLGFGWWAARNVWLYGDPTGYSAYRRAWAVSLRGEPFAPADLGELAVTQFRTFWGVFGWMNLPMPGWVYLVFAALSLAGIAGLLLARPTPEQRRGLALLAAGAVAAEAYVLLLVLECNVSCYQGRYLFPAIAPIALLLALGLGSLLPRTALTVVLTWFAVVSVAAPFAVIRPAYPTPVVARWQAARAQHPVGALFGDRVELVGYDLRRGPDALDVVLYWRAYAVPDFDYSAFVHLIDERGAILAQQDHAPGEAAGYPPKLWAQGDVVADRHVLSAVAGKSRVRVGLYNWMTGQQLPVTTGDRAGAPFVLLPD